MVLKRFYRWTVWALIAGAFALLMQPLQMMRWQAHAAVTDDITVFYHSGIGNSPFIHYGINGKWTTLPGFPMKPLEGSTDPKWFTYTISDVPQSGNLELTFHDGAKNWDSLGMKNYQVTLPQGAVTVEKMSVRPGPPDGIAIIQTKNELNAQPTASPVAPDSSMAPASTETPKPTATPLATPEITATPVPVITATPANPPVSATPAPTLIPDLPLNPAEIQHFAYMRGYPDGTFRPEKSVTRAEIAAMLIRLTGMPETLEESSRFIDISENSWAKTYAEAAAALGIMKGDPDGRFRPNATISRSEIRTMIGRMISLGLVKDRPENISAITIPWLVQNGTLRNVNARNAVIRREVVVIFNRLFERGPLFGIEEAVWSDVPYGDLDFEDILEASISHSSEKISDGEWILSIAE